MFSLKEHVCRHAVVVAVGAASLGLAAASQAADWDTGTYGPDDAASVTEDVNLVGDVTCGTLTFDGGEYSVTGNGNTITLTGVGANVVSLTNTGKNKIDAEVRYNFTGSGFQTAWKIDGDLTVARLTVGNYGNWRKQNGGILRVDTLVVAGNSVIVEDGTLLLTNKTMYSASAPTGTYSTVGGIIVNANGTLAGDATVSNGTANGTFVQINGHFAPGNNGNESTRDGSGNILPTFGDIGTFVFDTSIPGGGAYGTKIFEFGETAALDLDLRFPDLNLDGILYNDVEKKHDAIEICSNGFSYFELRIDPNATLNLFATDGFLVDGIYSIFTLIGSDYCGINRVDAFDVANINVYGLDDGLTKADYEFRFEIEPFDVGQGAKLNLVIEKLPNGGAVPEPASLGLLGLGAGLLMLRRKR